MQGQAVLGLAAARPLWASQAALARLLWRQQQMQMATETTSLPPLQAREQQPLPAQAMTLQAAGQLVRLLLVPATLQLVLLRLRLQAPRPRPHPHHRLCLMRTQRLLLRRGRRSVPCWWQRRRLW